MPARSTDLYPICNICGDNRPFIREQEVREGLLCSNCNASSRHRALVYILGLLRKTEGIPLILWPIDKSVRVLESSGRGSYPMILREKFDYYNTEYHPSAAAEPKRNTHYADFQDLSYPEQHFDVVIAGDVFEHIREDEKAFAEVYRVLKDGGALIFTVPYHHEWAQTLVRVRPEGDQDILLLPPEYHGGGGQTLAYRTYGRDLLDRLRACGFSVGYLEFDVPRYAIGHQVVFVGMRASFIDLSKFHSLSVDKEASTLTKASPLILFRAFLFLKYNLRSIGHFAREIRRRATEFFRKS